MMRSSSSDRRPQENQDERRQKSPQRQAGERRSASCLNAGSLSWNEFTVLSPNGRGKCRPSRKNDLKPFFDGKIRDRHFVGLEENDMAEIQIVRGNINRVKPGTLCRRIK